MRKRLPSLVLVTVFALSLLAGLFVVAPPAMAIPHCAVPCVLCSNGVLACGTCAWSPVLKRCICSHPICP